MSSGRERTSAPIGALVLAMGRNAPILRGSRAGRIESVPGRLHPERMTLLTARLGDALEFAAAHHDLITTAALCAADIHRNQISDLCRDGILERIVRGLYRVRNSQSPEQDALAAVMRHSHAVASHTTALFLHGMDVSPPTRPHIPLPPVSTSRASIAQLHRSPLQVADISRRRRIRVTSLARSIIDAAEQLTVPELASVVNEAVARTAVTITALVDSAHRAEREPGRVGSGRVRTVLGSWTDEIRPDSLAEATAVRRIVDFGLPTPVTQHEVADHAGRFVARVDLHGPTPACSGSTTALPRTRADRGRRSSEAATRSARMDCWRRPSPPSPPWFDRLVA